MAAVNLVMPFLLISFVFPDLIAVGSSGADCPAFGREKEEEASRIFTMCSLLIVVLSCLIGLAGFLGAEAMLQILGADAAVAALGAEYLRVYALFAPFIIVFYAVDNYCVSAAGPAIVW